MRHLGREDRAVNERAGWLVGVGVAAFVAMLLLTPTANAAPVLELSLDETSGLTANDSSGEDNDGTLLGPTWTGSGRYGGGAAFDGTNDWISVPDDASLDLTDEGTLEAWVKPSTPTSWTTILFKEAVGGMSYGLYGSDGGGSNLNACIGEDCIYAAAIGPDEWSHVAFTFDGDDLRLFINGVLAAEQEQIAAVSPSGDPLRIGGNNVWGEYFEGTIDEVRVHDTALTTSQIRDDRDVSIAHHPDVTDPSVTVDSPEDESTVGGFLDLEADASDDRGVREVQFFVDSVAVGSPVSDAPYELELNTRELTNGFHVITAKARDTAGNESATGFVDVTVDNQPPDPDPVLSLSFGEGTGSTTADDSGNANDATISGASWTNDGRSGSALSFDGTDDIVTVADDDSLDLDYEGTIEAWVKPDDLNSWATALMKEKSGGISYVLYAGDGDGPTLNSCVGDSCAYGPELTDGEWQHIATTFDNDSIKLYVNGDLAAVTPQTEHVAASSGPLSIGGNSVWGEHFAGVIDEVRVYEGARSQRQIAADFENLGLADRFDFETFNFTGGSVSVNQATGNTVILGGTGAVSGDDDDLFLTRYWNSFDSGRNHPTFGDGWSPEVGPEVRLTHDSSNETYRLIGSSGKAITFLDDGNGGWAAALEPDLEIDPSFGTGEIAVVDEESGVNLVFSGNSSDVTLPLARVEHEDGQNYDLTYDEGRLDELTGSVDGQAEFSYDGNDHLDELSIGEDSWDFAIDSSGQLDGVTYPDETEISYEYDGEGRIIEIDDLDDKTTTLAWDSKNRLTSVTLDDGGPDEDETTISYGNAVTPQCAGFEGTNTFTYSDSTYSKYCYDEDLTIRRTLSDADGGPIESGESISYLEDEFSMTSTQASDWLDDQTQAPHADADIRNSAASADYAGMWFDNANRRIKIGLTSSSNQGTVEDIVDGYGLTGSTDINVVSYSEEDLEEAREALDSDLESLSDDGIVRTTAEVDNQRVLVEVADDSSPGDIDDIEDAAGLAPVPTSVIQVDPSVLDSELTASGPKECNKLGCSQPLRGGVRIDPRRPKPCTVGFIAVRRSDDRWGAMTAGHCVDAGVKMYAQPNLSFFTNGYFVGQAGAPGYFGRNGDAGLIPITGPYWNRSLEPWVNFTDRTPPGVGDADTRYLIQRVATTRDYPKGRVICMASGLLGVRCGRIIGIGKANTDEGVIQGQVRVRICHADDPEEFRGSSGAPWVWRHAAMGIMSSYNPNTCEASFTKAGVAEDLTGADILLPAIN